jgi:hypothetical protein
MPKKCTIECEDKCNNIHACATKLEQGRLACQPNNNNRCARFLKTFRFMNYKRRFVE